MRVLRSIAAVLVGYVLFAAPVLAYFQVTGQPPHQPAPLLVMLGSMLVGVASALAGGYTAARIAGRKPLMHGVALAVVLAAGSIVSLVSTLGHGAIWSQVSALILMVPSAIAGSSMRQRQES